MNVLGRNAADLDALISKHSLQSLNVQLETGNPLIKEEFAHSQGTKYHERLSDIALLSLLHTPCPLSQIKSLKKGILLCAKLYCCG